MTYARKTLISLRDTPYYHVTARCVRRAWLWGFDEYAGRDYSHRKDWVLERLLLLTSVFAIEVCGYAVMSNHYHLILQVARERSKDWSLPDVVERWSRLFGIPPLVRRWVDGQADEAEGEVAEQIIAQWRERLSDISWFMKCLNEHLARRANEEDGCTGRFWEGRFRSQALLDEAALLTAMAYVDLNPIRAGIAATPEQSEFTSVHQRIQALRLAATDVRPRVKLKAFRSAALTDGKAATSIPFTLTDYLNLVDWTGRLLRDDKRGSIDTALPPILRRLNIDAAAWEATMGPEGNVFGRAIGRLDHLRLHASALGQRWIRGLHRAQRMYA